MLKNIQSRLGSCCADTECVIIEAKCVCFTSVKDFLCHVAIIKGPEMTNKEHLNKTGHVVTGKVITRCQHSKVLYLFNAPAICQFVH